MNNMRQLITSPGVDGGPFDKEGIALLNLGEDATESELSIEESRLVAEWEGNQYQTQRKERYDALNQMELISDDAINGTTTHRDAILAIKSDIPKPA